MLDQCCFAVGPAWQTVAQQQNPSCLSFNKMLLQLFYSSVLFVSGADGCDPSGDASGPGRVLTKDTQAYGHHLHPVPQGHQQKQDHRGRWTLFTFVQLELFPVENFKPQIKEI